MLQRLAPVTTAREQISSNLLAHLNYADLINFAHEVGNALVQESNPSKLFKLRRMYQDIADEHSLRLTGRPLQ